MTAYVGSTTGDWDVATNWTPNGVPVAGDTINISAGVTITTTKSEAAGTSGATGTDELVVQGTLIIGAGTLTATGDIRLTSGTLQLNAGTNISITGTYRMRYSGTSTLTVNGTSGSRCSIGATVSTSLRRVASTDILNGAPQYCDLTNFLDARSFEIDGLTATQSLVFTNCLFNNISRADFYQASRPGAASSLKFINCDFRGMPASYAFVIGDGTTWSFNANTHLFQNCTFSGNISGSLMLMRLGSNTNPYILDNIVSEDMTWNLNCYHTGQYLLHRQDNALQTCFSLINDAGQTYIHDSIVWGDYTNLHVFASAGLGGALFEDNISFSEEPSSFGNHYLPSEAANTTIVRRCITVGDNGVILRNGTGAISTVERLTHICTAANTDALGIIEAPGYSGDYTQRSCLEYSTSTAERLFQDLTATGLSAGSYLDYNCIWNRTFSDRYSVTMSGKTLGDVGFGSADISQDPTFVDAAANLKTWDTSLGGAGTIANCFSECLKMNGYDRTAAVATFDSNYTVVNALVYLRARLVPTNSALQGAGYGGEDIGALNINLNLSRSMLDTVSSNDSQQSYSILLRELLSSIDAIDLELIESIYYRKGTETISVEDSIISVFANILNRYLQDNLAIYDQINLVRDLTISLIESIAIVDYAFRDIGAIRALRDNVNISDELISSIITSYVVRVLSDKIDITDEVVQQLLTSSYVKKIIVDLIKRDIDFNMELRNIIMNIDK